ncbi:MAG: hypothetical protein AB7E70_11890 [Hyphomicrobiaceae bacterium]
MSTSLSLHMPAGAPGATADARATASDADVKALFHIIGNADPGLLARIVEPAAKLGLVPTRLFASRENGDGSEVNVDLRIAPLSARHAHLVAAALRSIVGVRQVICVIEPTGA